MTSCFLPIRRENRISNFGKLEIRSLWWQCRKTIRRPALRAQLVLDGDAAYPVLLDGNFDEDWGDCLYLQPILHHGEHRTHTVELTILPTDTPDATEFYLMALIVTG